MRAAPPRTARCPVRRPSRRPRVPRTAASSCPSYWSDHSRNDRSPTEGGSMTVLVTGAGGRIGRHVTRLLLESCRTVRALVLPADPSRAWLESQPGVEVVEGRLE